MSSELRLKKLRGSGGYIMATVTDEQQMKGNLGGPDLFLAPSEDWMQIQLLNIFAILVRKNLKVLQR